jgi:hypothetical protein
MVRFYFDIREDSRFVPDNDGMELADLSAAEAQAVEQAALLGRYRLPAGKTQAVTIEVRDGNGQQVATATVALHTTRTKPYLTGPERIRAGDG